MAWVTVAPTAPPNGRWPVAAVSAGLLFERRAGGLELWDPTSGRIVRRIAGASTGPTYRNLLAWCNADQQLHITDVAGGTAVATVAPPSGFRAFGCQGGAFAPVGLTLAVPVS